MAWPTIARDMPPHSIDFMSFDGRGRTIHRKAYLDSLHFLLFQSIMSTIIQTPLLIENVTYFHVFRSGMILIDKQKLKYYCGIVT